MEFSIDRIFVEENLYHVTGACYSGSVTINSCFLQVYRYLKGRDSEGFSITIGKEYIRDIKLQVKQIKAYGTVLDKLPEGMTGELWLTGEGGEHLQPRDLLVRPD